MPKLTPADGPPPMSESHERTLAVVGLRTASYALASALGIDPRVRLRYDLRPEKRVLEYVGELPRPRRLGAWAKGWKSAVHAMGTVAGQPTLSTADVVDRQKSCVVCHLLDPPEDEAVCTVCSQATRIAADMMIEGERLKGDER